MYILEIEMLCSSLKREKCLHIIHLFKAKLNIHNKIKGFFFFLKIKSPFTFRKG